jgi:hypothetical protein
MEKCLKVCKPNTAKACRPLCFLWMWLFRIEHHCHINGIKFQQLNGKAMTKDCWRLWKLQKTLELKKVSGLKTCTCLHFGVSLLNLQLFNYRFCAHYFPLLSSQGYFISHCLKLSINLLKTFTFKVICVLCFVSSVCAHLHFVKRLMAFSFSPTFKVVGISKKKYLSKPC